MPLILALGRQRQVNFCEFKASLVCRLSSRTTMATQRNLVSGGKKTTQTKNKNQTRPLKRNLNCPSLVLTLYFQAG